MDKKKLRVYILCAACVLSALLFLLGWIVLPDPLTVQLSMDGSSSNTMPKVIGLGLPVAVTVGFAAVYFFRPENIKYLIGSALGVLIFLLTFLFNL